MKIFILIAVVAAAIGGMWWYSKSKDTATPMVRLPIVPQVQNPTLAQTVNNMCTGTATKAANAVGLGGLPKLTGGKAYGCEVIASVINAAPLVPSAIKSAGSGIVSGAKSAWNAISPW